MIGPMGPIYRLLHRTLRTEQIKCDSDLYNSTAIIRRKGSVYYVNVIITVFLVVCQLPVGITKTVDQKTIEQSNDIDSENGDFDLKLIPKDSLSKYIEFPKPGDQDQQHYTHQWAAHIVGGISEADRIAQKHGFINGGEIFPDYYHLVHRKVAKRSVDAHVKVHGRLIGEPGVRWAEQQRAKRRSKRDFLSLPGAPSSGKSSGSGGGGRTRSARKSRNVFFNDPRWPAMWYLNRGAGLDMNVIEAWSEGITGKGIVVTILDDGLEKDHPDIVRNYDPMASFDVNSLDMDPMPTYDLTDSNRHGTRCAGEVAAEANNTICAVGIAFEAGIGGVRMLDGDVTDAVEARSLSHNPQHIDIYSASWGPDDDGKTVDGPGELATRAFMEGVTKGRNGKGSIFVWASGNGGRDHDNCNCDGYTNSIWTLSISSATENGLVPWYSEACSSTLATTYSSGGTGEKQIVTIDLHHSCTSSHTGTSASAPLAAGICALALQANTNLTWRDMQHIVVRTARPNNLLAPDWAINGVGRNVSHSFGYGLMDAGAMVKLSRKWKMVPEQHKCEIKAPYTDKSIPAKSKVTLDLKVTDCPDVKFLEHVQAKVTLTSGRRGDLQIYLVSPSGTRSVLLAHRRHDLNRSGFTDWPFMTVHCWGENPLGKWTLEIHNEGRYTGTLQTWSLISHGITSNPNDQGGDSGSGIGGNKKNTPTDTAISSGSEHKQPSVVEFDGSDNSIQANHQDKPPFASNSEIAADSSVSILSTSVASSPSSADCAKVSKKGHCLECLAGLALLNGACVTSCPRNYYVNSIKPSNGNNSKGDAVEQTRLTYICIPCHYSCRTCAGPNDFECLTCYNDANLHKKDHGYGKIETHCYSLDISDTIDNSDFFWYKAILLTLVTNAAVVVCVIVYIYRKRQKGSQFSDGRDPNRQWYLGRANRAYRRISPDEDNPSANDEQYELGIDVDSNDEEILSDSHDNVTLVENFSGRIINNDVGEENFRESNAFFKQNIINLHSNLIPKDPLNTLGQGQKNENDA